jgi:glycine dehydrogenase subunit 1
MFVPHSELDLKKMFDELSINSLDDLFTHIPDALLLENGLDLPESLSELESIDYFNDIAARNKSDLVCFAGGGHYDVYLPQTVKSLTMRPEFMTSYTPYQAEISQGILQVLFEFQSLVCDLTDMELANASLYDGATSIAEAISVAINKTKRDGVTISSGLNPNSKEVINTLIDKNKFNLNYVDLDNYLFPSDYDFDESQAAFVVSYPHYEGSCQDLTELVTKAKDKGIVTICYVDPSMLGVLTTPGQMGFDIIVAEGQSLGSPLSFGGPTVGWFATKKEFARLVPGRLIGESRDKDGNKSYVMTLRAREQDIRREKASSNICTNHSIQKANYMKKSLIKNGYVIPNDDSSLREFLLEVKTSASEVINKMGDKGFLAGIYYDDKHVLVAVTEKRKKTEIDDYIEALQEIDNG